MDMADSNRIANCSIADKSAEDNAEITQAVAAKLHNWRGIPQETQCSMSAITNVSARKGRISRVPSYLLARPLHDFDASGTGVSTAY